MFLGVDERLAMGITSMLKLPFEKVVVSSHRWVASRLDFERAVPDPPPLDDDRYMVDVLRDDDVEYVRVCCYLVVVTDYG